MQVLIHMEDNLFFCFTGVPKFSNDEHTVLLMQFSSTEKLRTLNPGEVINDQSTYANHGVVNTTLRLVNLPGCKDVVGLHFPGGKDSKARPVDLWT